MAGTNIKKLWTHKVEKKALLTWSSEKLTDRYNELVDEYNKLVDELELEKCFL